MLRVSWVCRPWAQRVGKMERFVVWNTEMGAKLLQPGVETGLLIYDMSGFGMKNLVCDHRQPWVGR